MKTKTKLVGAGIGLTALAAAGTYFLYGKRGAKNRETVRGWALQLKGQILDKMESLESLDPETYNKVVEETVERFGRVKKISAAELALVKADLKNAWSRIGRELH